MLLFRNREYYSFVYLRLFCHPFAHKFEQALLTIICCVIAELDVPIECYFALFYIFAWLVLLFTILLKPKYSLFPFPYFVVAIEKTSNYFYFIIFWVFYFGISRELLLRDAHNGLLFFPLRTHYQFHL